jgi:hypothetical protein
MSKRPTRRTNWSPPPPPPPPIAIQQDDDVDIENDGEMDELDDDEYDSEAEAHAEALARQMHDQLAAEIGKVYGLKSDGTPDPIIPIIRHLLDFASTDSRVHSLLTATSVMNGSYNAFDLLTQYLDLGGLGASISSALSHALLNLLDGSALDQFDPPSVIGKRKRETIEHSPLPPPSPLLHPPTLPALLSVPIPNSIESRIRSATTVALTELTDAKTRNVHLLPVSLKPQLGQIYHFTSTYADAADPSSAPILREIGKLIKDTDILDKSQLAYPPTPSDAPTAVFICYRPSCTKLFDSQIHLSQHYTTSHSPSNQTRSATPSSKPKVTLQYQCDACKALFPGRDALRSHQANAASPACIDASSNVIELQESTASPSVSNRLSSSSPGPKQDEGELDPAMLIRAQVDVARLHGPLKERAERARAALGISQSEGGLRVGRGMGIGLDDVDVDEIDMQFPRTLVAVEPDTNLDPRAKGMAESHDVDIEV